MVIPSLLVISDGCLLFFLILFSKFIISKLKFILLRNIIRFSAKRYKLIKKKRISAGNFFFGLHFHSFISQFFRKIFNKLFFSSLELRSHVDDIYNIGFRDVPNPITHAWQCGRDAFCANVSKDRLVN